MRVVGLDPSLTGFGVALVEDGRVLDARRLPVGTSRGHVRLERLLDALAPLTVGAHLAVIEGPSFRSASVAQTGHHERAGLWWLLAHAMWIDATPYAVVAPATRAKYATGSGTAGKADVVAAVSARWGIGTVVDDNVADALVLAAMGARALGEPVDVDPPERALLAMEAVDWSVAVPA